MSGVEATDIVAWLPNLPQHWTRKRLKLLFRLVGGGTPSKENADYWVGEMPWVSSKDMKVDIVNDTEDHISDQAVRSSATNVVPEGTILIVARSGILRHTIPVAITGRPVAINQDIKAFLPRRAGLEARYYAFLIQGFQDQLLTLWRSQGATVESLDSEIIGNTDLPLPPSEEQCAIVDLLDRETAKIDSLIKSVAGANWATTIDRRCVGGMLGRLFEHRSALIIAAVSGQIETTVPVNITEANDNREAIRVAVGAEIVCRCGSTKTFGRVKFQKLLYLAEVHTGIALAGNYVREAAGPLARDLLSATEQGMAAGGFYKAVASVGGTNGIAYQRVGAVGAHRNQFKALLGEKAEPLTRLIDLLKDFNTREVEAITTLYAVWNDALLDGEQPDDPRIIRGFLEEWHPEKRTKFKAADLPVWLAWMRRNGVVPSGRGTRTYSDQLSL